MKSGTAYDAWLHYALCEDNDLLGHYNDYTELLSVKSDSAVIRTAAEELSRGIAAITGREPKQASSDGLGGIILGVFGESSELNELLEEGAAASLSGDGYLIRTLKHSGERRLVLAG